MVPLSWLGEVIEEFTTSSAPASSAPATMVRPAFLSWIHALSAEDGPTNAASSWPASSAVISSGPALNTVVCSWVLPSLPWKKPLPTPTSAVACVMLAKYPRRSVVAGVPVGVALPVAAAGAVGWAAVAQAAAPTRVRAATPPSSARRRVLFTGPRVSGRAAPAAPERGRGCGTGT